jgi:hypothetical protein
MVHGAMVQKGAARRDPDRLARFIGAQAAFIAQKTVLDYCRVKAGRHEAEMFSDADFQGAIAHCRWSVYLSALSDVTAMVEAWLRPGLPEGVEAALARALVRVHAQVLAAEPPPPAQAEAARDLAAALPGHLAALQMAPPRLANRLPLLAEAPLFATLPIHPAQRRGEEPSIRGALRFHVVATQQELERRFDRTGLAAALARAGAS